MVKNLLSMHENWVRFLGLSDPLEKGMATHSSIVAWRFPLAEVLSHVQLFMTPWTTCSIPGFPVLHYLSEFAPVLVH